MELVAKLLKAYDAVPVGQKGTLKRGFLVERSQMFNDDIITKEIYFSCWGDRTKLLDNFKAGDKITISFDMSSRENPNKEGQFFTDLNAFKIVKKTGKQDGGYSEVQEDLGVTNNPAKEANEPLEKDDEIDPLPF